MGSYGVVEGPCLGGLSIPRTYLFLGRCPIFSGSVRNNGVYRPHKQASPNPYGQNLPQNQLGVGDATAQTRRRACVVMHVTAPLFVSPRIAAEMLGYESIEPVYQAIREGRLPAKRFGSRTLRIKVADIESFGTPVEGDAA